MKKKSTDKAKRSAKSRSQPREEFLPRLEKHQQNATRDESRDLPKANEGLPPKPEKLTNILKAMPDGIYIVTEQYEIEYANPAVVREFGPILNRKCHDYFHDLPDPCAWCRNEEVFAGKTVRWQWSSPKTGKTYDVFNTAVSGSDGTVSKLTILRNITEQKKAEETVSGNEAMMRAVFDVLPVGVWIVDQEGRVHHGNRAGKQIWGGTKDVDGIQWGERNAWWLESGKKIEPDEWPSVRALTMGKTSLNEEIEIESLDGARKIISDSAMPIRNDRNEIVGAVVVNQDITEQQKYRRRLEATNAILSSFIEKPLRKGFFDEVVQLVQQWSGCHYVGIRLLDDEGNIPYESHIGFSEVFWKSENWLSVGSDQCACTRIIAGRPDSQDGPLLTPGGSFHCNNTSAFLNSLTEEDRARFRGGCVREGFESVAIVPIGCNGKTCGAIHLAGKEKELIPMDMVELIETVAPLLGEAVNRFNLERKISQSETRLRNLSSQLITAQEDERKRISEDIHDSLGQSLSALKFKIEIVAGRMESKDMMELTESLLPLVRTCIEDSRRIQMALRPAVLDDMGIITTISWFCREFSNIYSHISIEKEIGVEEEEVPPSLKTPIYRIMQEAMNNVTKYSKADRVRISLVKNNDHLEFTVRDNGEGFDVKSESRGMGLSSMRERAELSGGSFAIVSALGASTTIRASWPLEVFPR